MTTETHTGNETKKTDAPRTDNPAEKVDQSSTPNPPQSEDDGSKTSHEAWYQKRAVRIGGAVAGALSFLVAGIGIGTNNANNVDPKPEPSPSAPATPGLSPEASPSPTVSETEPAEPTTEQIERRELGYNGFNYVTTEILPDEYWVGANGDPLFGEGDEVKTTQELQAAREALSLLEANKTWLIETGNLPVDAPIGQEYDDVLRATFANIKSGDTDINPDFVDVNTVIGDVNNKRADSTQRQQTNPSYPLRQVTIDEIISLKGTDWSAPDDTDRTGRFVMIQAVVTEIIPDPDSPADSGVLKKVTQLRSYNLAPEAVVRGWSEGGSRKIAIITFEQDDYGDISGTQPSVVETIAPTTEK